MHSFIHLGFHSLSTDDRHSGNGGSGGHKKRKTILGVEDDALAEETKPTQQKQKVTNKPSRGDSVPGAPVREVPKRFRGPSTCVSPPVRGVLQRRWNLVSEIKTGFVVVAAFRGDRRAARLDLSGDH